MSDDALKIIEFLREAAGELENAHRLLDHLSVPDTSEDHVPFALAARIALLAEDDDRGN